MTLERPFGQRPQRGRSSVEHRGTFVCLFSHSFFRLFVPPLRLSNLKSAFPGLYLAFLGLISVPLNLFWPKQTNRQTNESPPVFYRTSSPLGPLPCFPSLQFTITQSRATGIADHILPLGDLFRPAEKSSFPFL